MLLQNTVFSWTSLLLVEEHDAPEKEKITLTSVCGLGLEKVMLSDGGPSHHIPEQKQNEKLRQWELHRGCGSGQSCRIVGKQVK